MLEILISFAILSIIIFSSGLIFSKLLFASKNIKINIFENALLGIFFYILLSFFIHFFLPLSQIVNLVISITFILIIFFLINKKIFLDLEKNKFIIFFSLILVIIMTLKYKPNEDYGFYHLPYIINIVSEKIIFGLSSLQPQFAWNSTWLNFSSNFYLPILGLKGTQLTNSLLYFFSIGFFLKKIFIKNKNSNLNNFLAFSILCYVIIKFTRISEHGFDFPANIFLLISFFYFLELFNREKSFSEKNIAMFFIFSTLSISIKLNTIPIMILVFITFFILLKKKFNFNKIILPLFFSFLFLSFWLTQQFIYTSCLQPFLEFTCYKSSVWFNQNLIDALQSMTGVINKSYWHYSGNLTPEEYAKNFNWVSTWFNRNKIELSEHIFSMIFPIIIIILINFKKLDKREKKFEYKIKQFNFVYIALFILSGLMLWFFKSPVIRFGSPYIFLSLFFIIYFLLNIYYKEILIKNGLIYIVCLDFLFNISKNIKRIYEVEEISFWPEILEIKYKQIKIDNYVVNYPDSEIVSTKHNLCWSIPFMCDISKGKNLRLEKKGEYIVILRGN